MKNVTSLTIRIPQEMKAELKQLARRDGISVSRYVRRAIRQYQNGSGNGKADK